MAVTGRSICFLLIVVGLVQCSLGRTVSPAANGMGVEEANRLYKCHGMDEVTCELHKSMMSELSQRVSVITGQPAHRATGDDEESEGVESCIILTVDQLDAILNDLDNIFNSSTPRNSRKRRNLVDFMKVPLIMWTMPVPYRFDGVHSEDERAIIRSAAQHWMDNTCVRFREIPQNEKPTYHHIILTNQPKGCSSYVGKALMRDPYQPINLGDNCLNRFGTPVHEFGHSLGLNHEQSRVDRDDWITIVRGNLLSSALPQFESTHATDPLGVPYDYSSVMQYSSLDGISANGKDTIVAKNPLYQMNMGQRTGLSFNDIRLINKAYCAGSCSGRTLSRPCQHGGYQNPNNCSRCHCPDGLSGDFCEKVAPPRNAQCGGEINLISPSDRVSIMSPGYQKPMNYESFQDCSWWLKAPVGYNLKLTFDGPFGLYCEYTACYHWVEVKYKADIGLEGARFCCYQTPIVTIKSESNEMLVVFKSNYSVPWTTARRGFLAHISLEKKTMPKPFPSGLNWICSFEPAAAGGSQFCGMIQDKTDQFDWTPLKGPTPSDLTGPDFAADKDYYIYIEASDPARPNDEARIYLPDFTNYTGDVCVRFSYHMYGFHVRALKFVEVHRTTKLIKELWSHKGQIGNVWHEASVNTILTQDKQLQFIGVRGDEFSGDIAVDNIRVNSGKCA